MIKRQSMLIFAALFLAGVFCILAGRLIGWNPADEPAAATTTPESSRLGTALEQAMGLAPSRTPDATRPD
jgi:hypothetical protein